jgi:hypothetical protein
LVLPCPSAGGVVAVPGVLTRQPEGQVLPAADLTLRIFYGDDLKRILLHCFGGVPFKYTNTIAALDTYMTASFALGYRIDFPLNGSLPKL